MFVLFAALFENLKSDLLAGTKAGGMFSKQFTGWTVKLLNNW